MRRSLGQSILFLTIALFTVTASLLLLQDAGAAPGEGPGEERVAGPSYIAAYRPTSPELMVVYPPDPAPGDFLVVEAGPFPGPGDVEIDFDFPGTMSPPYRAGDLYYALIAVSYETPPGTYRLAVQQEGDSGESLEATLLVTDREFQVARFRMPAGTTTGWTRARLAEDREKVRLARETSSAVPLWQQAFIAPLEGRISSEYGAIRYIDDNPPRRHSGIDIATEEGEAVVAPNRGVVRLAEFLLSGGNTVIIDHGLDLSTTYMHLHEIAVSEGRQVERGELIGTVGMTGFATGPHLHWEANIGQVPVNPDQLLVNELLLVAPAHFEAYAGGP